MFYMIFEATNSNELLHYEQLIDFYLKYGSVEAAFYKEREKIFISIASYYRLIKEWGIVRAVGPHTDFDEKLLFFTLFATAKLPLETFHRLMMLPSFKTSYNTLIRSFREIRRERTTKEGAALVITPEGLPDQILVGEETSSRYKYGKKLGDLSVPMGFSRKDESPYLSILRLLQMEVSNPLVLEREFVIGSDTSAHIIGEEQKPFMTIDIADTRVNVYHLNLPNEHFDPEILVNHRLRNMQLMTTEEILSGGLDSSLRTGIPEIVKTYQDVMSSSQDTRNPIESPILVSNLNRQLAQMNLSHPLWSLNSPIVDSRLND